MVGEIAPGLVGRKSQVRPGESQSSGGRSKWKPEGEEAEGQCALQDGELVGRMNQEWDER